MIKTSKSRISTDGVVAVVLSLSLLSPWLLGVVVSKAYVPDNPPGVVQGNSEGGLRYMSGGIGTEERDFMKRQAPRYNLRLSFAVNSGQYLSEGKLVIENQDGKQIMGATTNGPWFYVQLPPGKYTVKAMFEGRAKEIKNLILTGDQPLSRIMHWDLGLGPTNKQ